MKNLLELQALDARIHACRMQEEQIPRQKDKFKSVRDRLAAELAEAEKGVTSLELEQRNNESEIEQKKEQIGKYEQQLGTVKKNEEYQALLHEIDQVKKAINQREERILNIMEELEEAKARLGEDKKRIAAEQAEIDKQCTEIDQELAEAVKSREVLEKERPALEKNVDREMLSRYNRIRRQMNSGDVVVPLREEVCAGCNMHMRPQIVNEILEGQKVHQCQHCGRILYHPGNVEEDSAHTEAATGAEVEG